MPIPKRKCSAKLIGFIRPIPLPTTEQVFFDAFSSPDLVHWTKHPRIMSSKTVPWARRAIWAPAVAEKDGRYFIFFGANDIQKDGEVGGLGVAVSDKPEGPFTDYLGKPLIDRFHHGAQPIDPFVFRDSDGQYYLIYGGWGHCNVCLLTDDFAGSKTDGRRRHVQGNHARGLCRGFGDAQTRG